jgi:redox-sensitive bicupin YhaK (pirin superfamily)
LWMRLIAGEAFGVSSSTRIHSPLFYFHVKLDRNVNFTLPESYTERAIYIVKGSLEIAHTVYHAKQMVVFQKGEEPVITANENSVVMMLGGEPLGERFIWWNFVSSRRERIEQAKVDWKEGRILLPPADNQEFVPLPEDRSSPAPAPEPLS